jgi:hypothetical protein
MNIFKERLQKQHEYHQWYREQNCEVFLELQCVADMNETQNGYRLLSVGLT